MASILALVAALAALGAALLLRRRGGRTGPGLPRGVAPLPAGVKHLASTVSDLSDLGLHLPPPRAGGKPRLGALLGLR